MTKLELEREKLETGDSKIDEWRHLEPGKRPGFLGTE